MHDIAFVPPRTRVDQTRHAAACMLEPLPCEGARPLPEDASLVDDSGDSVSSEAEYSDEYLDALGDEGEGVAAAWEPLSSFVPGLSQRPSAHARLTPSRLRRQLPRRRTLLLLPDLARPRCDLAQPRSALRQTQRRSRRRRRSPQRRPRRRCIDSGRQQHGCLEHALRCRRARAFRRRAEAQVVECLTNDARQLNVLSCEVGQLQDL